MKYRELVRRLREIDRGFNIDPRRGKGSHRMITREGSRRHYPIPYHGDNEDVPAGMVRDIERIFDLDKGVLSQK